MRNPYRHPERMAQSYAPVRDPYLSQRLGFGVSVYNRAPGHMARGYADRAQRNVNLSSGIFEQLNALRTFGNQGRITPQMARSAYVAAHEWGHLQRGNSEDAANAWASAHVLNLLSRLGLNRAARRRVLAYDRQQLLI